MALKTELVMTPHVISVRPEDDLATAFKKFKEHHIRHLPVIDKDNKLVGILSDRDLTQFSAGSFVREFMSSPVETAAVDTPLGEITQKMLDRKISALAVVKDGKVAGIITSHDLLKVLKVFLRSHSQPPERVFDFKYNTAISEVLYNLSQMGI